MQQCADSKPEQDDAGHRSDRIRNRLRDDNAPDRGWQQLGQEEDQRDQQDQLAQRGNEDRDFRLPQRDKRLLKRDLEPKDQDTEEKYTHGLGGQADQLRVAGEHPNRDGGEKDGERPDYPGEQDTEKGAVSDRRADAVMVTRAVVVTNP